jgi:hypothetical protein
VTLQAEVEPKGSAVVTWTLSPDNAGAGEFVPAQGNKVKFVIGKETSGSVEIKATADGKTDSHIITIA